MNVKFAGVICCLLLVAGIASPVALAEKGYYKWMDSRGNPQHSDRPPPGGTEYEFISTDSGMSRRVTAEESRANASDASNAPAMPPPSKDTQTVADKRTAIEKNPALCDQAKANVDTLNSNARVRIRDGDEIRYLTPDEKDKQMQRAKDLMAVHCN